MGQKKNSKVTEGKSKFVRYKDYIIAISFLCLLSIVCVSLILWYKNKLFNNITIEKDEDVERVAESFEIATEEEKIGLKELEDTYEIPSVTPSNVPKVEKNEVYNFLLCGVEAIGGGRGRSDCIILVTLDTKHNAVKMTSLMRDTYVSIPGYKKNKLNAAYAQGGGPLLVETVKNNFSVDVDGYVVVDFDGFESIIDKLGGVDITLTKTEANYLNTNNYISDYKNRNLKEGLNHMNGNQALGYSRVRYVRASNGAANDFGRNYRQRTVLNTLFNTYKSKSLPELLMILPDITALLTTNMEEAELEKYLNICIDMNISDLTLKTYSVPIDGLYTCGMINKMSVLQITDINKTCEKLHEFLYLE